MKNKLSFQNTIPPFFITLFLIILLSNFIGNSPVSPTQQEIKNKDFVGYLLFYKLFDKLDYKVEIWSEKKITVRNSVIFFIPQMHSKIESSMLRTLLKKGNTIFISADNKRVQKIIKLNIEAQIINRIQYMGNIAFFPDSRYIKVILSATKKSSLLTANTGSLLLKKKQGKGHLYLYSTPKLFMNHMLLNENYAVFLHLIFTPFHKKTIYIYGYDKNAKPDNSGSPLRILFKGSLLFVILHLIILAIIFVLWKTPRLGSPVIAAPRKRRSLGEHLLALGIFYRKTKKEQLAIKKCQDYFITRTSELLGSRNRISINALTEAISNRLNIPKKEIKDLINKKNVKSFIQHKKRMNEIIQLLRKI